MATKEDETSDQKEIILKTSHGIILVPQPSEDPKDPLNWPMSKKILTLGIISFASFIGLSQSLANQSGFFPQALLYHKKPVQLSYSVDILTFYLTSCLAYRCNRSVPPLWALSLVLSSGLHCRNTSAARLSSSGEQ